MLHLWLLILHLSGLWSTFSFLYTPSWIPSHSIPLVLDFTPHCWITHKIKPSSKNNAWIVFSHKCSLDFLFLFLYHSAWIHSSFFHFLSSLVTNELSDLPFAEPCRQIINSLNPSKLSFLNTLLLSNKIIYLTNFLMAVPLHFKAKTFMKVLFFPRF